MLRVLCVAATVVMTALGVAPRSGADPLADLMSMLPSGYSSGSCKPVGSPGALAAVECRNNSLPGGPTFATYSLFRDYTGMYDAFTKSLKDPAWIAMSCPSKSSPEPFAVLGSDGKPTGFFACAHGEGADWQARNGALAWTRNAEHFLGVATVRYEGQLYPAGLFNWVRGPQLERDCAAAGGKYTAWHGDAEIYYSNCCFTDHCDEYVDGTYQGRSQA
ncbi:hypothetical protein MPRG_35070 [Mycobacterium paragordonae]|uniref:Septum formation-related domain-containing protein n=1 Tax=Mycobacterium paragordonae TaxID=1389713 RepID=A0ABQ1C702_9MYCO|nr:hypothetical protein MPRG_35070 [Mycobacterium paragordonae]